MEHIDEVLIRVAEDREGVNWDWSRRCAPFAGSWTPADHVYFLHGSEDVKQDHYITIARSNAYALQMMLIVRLKRNCTKIISVAMNASWKNMKWLKLRVSRCASHGFKPILNGFRTLSPCRVFTMHMSAVRLT